MNRRSSLVFVCALTAVSCGRSAADSASLSSGYGPASAEALARAVLPNAMYSPPDETPRAAVAAQRTSVTDPRLAVGTRAITLPVDNFQNYPARAWLATLADTGHGSVSNSCGILDSYTDGRGPGQRAANLFERFTSLNLDAATDWTALLVRSFFEKELNGASNTSLPEIAARPC